MYAYWGNEPAWTKAGIPTGEIVDDAVVEKECTTELEVVKKKFSSDFSSESCGSDGANCTKMSLGEFTNVGSCSGSVSRGSVATYKETNLEVGTVQENEIIFKAISEYCGTDFCQGNNETVNKIEKEFIIAKENGEWKIKYFYLPN